MHSLLKYANNKFEVDDITFSNSIVSLIHPEYACDPKIKELSYKVGSPNNCIYYNDGLVISLSDYEPKYNNIILLASKFQFEENEILIKEQAQIINKPKPSISTSELFRYDITPTEQQEKIKLLQQYAPEVELTDEFYFTVLDKIKKNLLKSSDWTQLPDVQSKFTEEQKEKWVDYRASLREFDKVKNPLLARIPLMPN